MSHAVKPQASANAISNIREAVRAEPGLGNMSFQVKARSHGGLAVRVETGSSFQNGKEDNSRAGKFSNIGDEPPGILGADTGMSPTEYILQALAGCYTATLTLMAAEKGIELEGIELDLYFDIDMKGFLGLDQNVRKGAKSIRVNVRLDSNTATREQLEELVRLLPENSPIHDTLANPVLIETRLV
ncbi:MULTISPECIES: OsmC family protein [Morganellaceae]|uniref:OsmC family protein n=1 Tax=Morganellaceae TaxID=1903414 RepID=UPI0018E40BE0|nr:MULTISPECIES: OsmC family protein [Morganellaceae]MBI6530068.1 OsmC family protein [Proteus vulgaris]MBP6082207.1 OsmC family protein [Providencia sp.]